MQDYQKAFIELCITKNILSFGQFTLKSGRNSPYFFNAGKFNTGTALRKLGEFYATAIKNSGIAFDTLFGPAYKGIPLVASAAIAFSDQYDCDMPYCFNRKEAKDHGEGGQIVGADLSGRVLIIDDVITAGTAIGESMQLLNAHKANLAGVVVAMDRQERGKSNMSAIQEVEETYGAPVISIIKLNDIIEYLKMDDSMRKTLEDIKQYQQEFGV